MAILRGVQFDSGIDQMEAHNIVHLFHHSTYSCMIINYVLWLSLCRVFIKGVSQFGGQTQICFTYKLNLTKIFRKHIFIYFFHIQQLFNMCILLLWQILNPSVKFWPNSLKREMINTLYCYYYSFS